MAVYTTSWILTYSQWEMQGNELGLYPNGSQLVLT